MNLKNTNFNNESPRCDSMDDSPERTENPMFTQIGHGIAG
jgi:hypothetical protein